MKYALIVICMASSLVPFMGSALNLALPYINKELSLDVVASGWIPASYMLSTAVLQVPFARVADILGRRRMFIWGVAAFTLFSLLSGLARSGAELIVYRFLSGAGSAMMFGTSMAMLTAIVPPQRRGWALGINTSVVYTSLALGPLFGGIFTQYLGWRSIFWMAALMGLAVIVGTISAIKEEWKEAQPAGFDVLGTLMYTTGMCSVIYGFSRMPSTISFVLLICGAVVLWMFGRYELKAMSPVFSVREFLGNRIFRLSTLSALINYAATFAVSFMLSLYLQDVRGLSPRDAGFVLISQSVVMAVTALISGRLSDRMPASRLATAGMAIVALGLLSLCFVSASTPFVVLSLMLVALGLGFGLFSSPNTNVIMSSVSKSHYSMASATAGTMRLTGQAFSMGFALMAMAMHLGSVQLSSDLHAEMLSSMRLVFIICTALCLGGVWMSAVRSNRH
ncbi:MAG: MFS transporter [Tannerellaceae bacterium]|jgi:MFS family permease|nr:MFS transporter [Tannerellaceae bacterium]